MRQQPETPLKNQIVEALNLFPDVCVWVTNSGEVQRGKRIIKLAPPGTPDITGHVRWLALYFEVKLAHTKLNAEQVEWHAQAIRDGALVFTVRSVSEAVAIIRKLLSATEAATYEVEMWLGRYDCYE